jgi:hypothetical protein
LILLFKISLSRFETTGPTFLVPTLTTSISLIGASITPFKEPNVSINVSAIFTETPGHCAKQLIANCL